MINESSWRSSSFFQYAKEKGLRSLKFLIYANNLFKFDGIFYLDRAEKVQLVKFPSDKLLFLREKISPKKWYIPVKVDEDFGICLRTAIEILRDNQLEQNVDCQAFLDSIVPDAFTKVKSKSIETNAFLSSLSFSYKHHNRFSLGLKMFSSTFLNFSFCLSISFAFDFNKNLSQQFYSKHWRW